MVTHLKSWWRYEYTDESGNARSETCFSTYEHAWALIRRLELCGRATNASLGLATSNDVLRKIHEAKAPKTNL